VTQPAPIFERLGGEAGVRALVDRFYDLMDARPEAAPIRAMHASDLKTSRDKLFLFLVGWTGGPPLYVERYGHPRLRRRHLPFAIDSAARDQWLGCMRDALEHEVSDSLLREHLMGAFIRIADHMRNTPDPA
jgi:hemoglobin